MIVSGCEKASILRVLLSYFIVPLNSLTVCKAQVACFLQAVKKRLGVFYLFGLNFSVNWAEVFCMIWSFVSFIFLPVLLRWLEVPSFTLEAESTRFWATHDEVFSGCEWGILLVLLLEVWIIMITRALRATHDAIWSFARLYHFRAFASRSTLSTCWTQVFRCDLFRLVSCWVAAPALLPLCVSQLVFDCVTLPQGP